MGTDGERLTAVPVVVSAELAGRLEAVPDAGPGPPYRYRFRRDLVERLSEVVLLLPAHIEEIMGASVRVKVDLEADRAWLPLLTNRMLPRPAEDLRKEREAEQLVADVASALANMGMKASEAKRIAKENYAPGDGFDELLKKSLGR